MTFEELYSKYEKDVYYFLLGLCGDAHTAEDITSETFIKALKAIDKFQGKSGIKTWLFQIAKNTFYTYAKKRKYNSELTDDLKTDENIEQKFLNQEQALEIHKILHLLDEPYKEVFTLRFFSELSYQEIGDLFEKTANWAMVTCYRAKNKIKEATKNDKRQTG